jgi:alginate O-acetyltransferase complex protein AlgJ
MREFVTKYSLIISFVTFLVFIGLNQWVGFHTFHVPTGNERDKDSIAIDVTHLDRFPGEFDAYYGNTFNFRGPLLHSFSKYSYHIVKKTPVEDKVILGSDDWCFMGDTYTDFYKCKRQFSEAQIDSIVDIWETRIKYFDSLHIPVYWVIGPMKNQIYSDKMPFNIRKGKGKTRLQNVSEKVNKAFPNLMINPTNRLKEAKGKHKLYYKLDNHWNLTSGRIASEMLIDQIRADKPEWLIPDFPVFEWQDSTITGGNLKATLGMEALYEEDVFPIEKNSKAKQVEKIGYPVTPGFGYDYVFEFRYKNKVDSEAPRILLFRDSYAFQMAPFINECFSESLYIFDAWQYKLDKSIVESYKPDVVVFVTVEANLHILLEYGALELE